MIKIQREKVYLSKLQKEVFLNPISIADDDWIGEQWDKDTLEKAFREVNVDILFAMFWRILDDEGKRAVAKAQIVSWEGLTEKVVQVDDPVQKLKLIVSGGKEILAIMSGIYETRKKSNPDPVKSEKKSLTEELFSQTQNSSTSSRVNMESTKKASESSPDANSLS